MDIAKLALEDGTVFTGTAFGARGEIDGEVVFNTSMTGYQEILTDPSYHGQIVTMTYPQIGNYGVNDEDAESRRPWVRGFVIRELSGRVSNFRAAGSLEGYLDRHGIIGIEGIDTRALVRLTRERGAMKGILSTTDLDDASLVAKAQASPGLVGRDLASEVMPGRRRPGTSGCTRRIASSRPGSRQPSVSGPGHPPAAARHPHVVALDFGMKWNIPRHLVDLGCRVTVVPGSATADAILDHEPDGIFLSNGPGDPAALTEATATLRTLIRTAAADSRASRSSASAWAISSWARRSAPGRSSSSSATAAPITRSATSGPARSRSRRRTTASPSIPRPCRPTSSPATSTSTTRPSKDCGTRACRSSASSITPRPPPARTTVRISSTNSAG